MRPVQIFITHYVNKDMLVLNDILVEEATYLEKITNYPHELIIVENSPDGSSDELYERLPGIRIEKNNRPGRNDIQPSMRNKVIELANQGDGEWFILLHNDVRVTVWWLHNLLSDMRNAEGKYGTGNVIITPRYIPYWYVDGIITPKYPSLWEELRKNVVRLDIGHMRNWCKGWQFKMDNEGRVYSPENISYITDDGNSLMMFISSKKCFDDRNGGIGDCDESFLGWGYDDNDWGIRALMTGKKNLKSQGCLMGHIEGLTFYNKDFPPKKFSHNADIFIKKWGRNIWDEMETGQLWIRLHNEQKQKGL